jgi:hypothetical protein
MGKGETSVPDASDAPSVLFATQGVKNAIVSDRGLFVVAEASDAPIMDGLSG